MKRRLVTISLLFLITAGLQCLPFWNRPIKVDTSTVTVRQVLRSPDVIYRPALHSPAERRLEQIWVARNIRIWPDDLWQQRSDSLEIPGLKHPHLQLWSPIPVNRPTQRNIQITHLEPRESTVYQDDLRGNRIRYWSFYHSLADQSNLTVKRTVEFTSYALEYDIQADRIGTLDSSMVFFRAYTSTERGFALPKAFQDSIRTIVQPATTLWERTLGVAEWITTHAEYHYPPARRGAAAMLKTMRGDCGQYSTLFVAMCRYARIPARLVSGFHLSDDNQWHYHIWAQVFIPHYGWVPVDLTLDNAVPGRMDNRYLITSVGSNIECPNAPPWATFQNSEVEGGTTPFMQWITRVHAGFDAHMSTTIK
jgi:transglutaminase-like putative cysteine protease